MAFLWQSRLHGIFDDLLHLLVVHDLVLLLVLVAVFGAFEFEVDVVRQVLFFKSLPAVSELLNNSKGAKFLLFGEWPVLTQGVQADDVLDLAGHERCRLDGLPLSVLGRVLLAGILFLLADLLLQFFPVLDFLQLLLFSLRDHLEINDGLVECLLEQARVVLKLNCKIRTQAGHRVEEHAWLADDLLDVYVPRQFFLLRLGRLWLSSLFVFVLILSWLLLRNWVFLSKQAIGDTLVLLEDLVYQELMLAGRVRELDLGLS